MVLLLFLLRLSMVNPRVKLQPHLLRPKASAEPNETVPLMQACRAESRGEALPHPDDRIPKDSL
jgi:hypothetical protein